MAEWYVYMVLCADNSLYTGVAKDVALRVSEHNAGLGAKYTRSRRPVVLVYRETAGDYGAALRREVAIKRLRPAAKRQLITELGVSWSSQVQTRRSLSLEERFNLKD